MPPSIGAAGRGREQIRTITSAEELARIATVWDALVASMHRPSPFLLTTWLVPWATHYADVAELEIHLAERDGELLAALPLCITTHRGIRRLSAPGGSQALLCDALLKPGADPALVDDLLRHASRRARHHLMEVNGTPQGGLLSRSARGRGFHAVERVEAPVLDSRGSWAETYRDRTSSKTRNTHKRRRRQLAEQGTLITRVARTPDEIGACLDETFRLHELRWRNRPDGSDYASPRGVAFQREALHGYAERDLLRIVMLELDGRGIAFHSYFNFAQRMYVYRLAFDPALARFSPGLINTLDALEAGIDEGVQRVEFLGGADRYKADLADRFEPLDAVFGMARGPAGHAAVGLAIGTVKARKRLKQNERLRRIYFDTLGPLRALRPGGRPGPPPE